MACPFRIERTAVECPSYIPDEDAVTPDLPPLNQASDGVRLAGWETDRTEHDTLSEDQRTKKKDAERVTAPRVLFHRLNGLMRYRRRPVRCG